VERGRIGEKRKKETIVEGKNLSPDYCQLLPAVLKCEVLCICPKEGEWDRKKEEKKELERG